MTMFMGSDAIIAEIFVDAVLLPRWAQIEAKIQKWATQGWRLLKVNFYYYGHHVAVFYRTHFYDRKGTEKNKQP